MTTINDIKEHSVIKQVLADSFGGIMYNVANRGKYDTCEILALWDGLSACEQGAAGGIIKGAINFLKGN